ncbi:hypothetical protein PgNI_10477 [Pyricularia grisea]|uniref:MARVEL domain-containing protein n=1 Tax=Pyricularia grisea TaxID=148305 RepID=A0A6P8AZT4_PYRGI|nr:hypothetical protein PgNI_10477 [Pyricularia grisea]TLD07908.1 hypothetical protein PgNI_10477 [Pyricularia grisea]
MNPLHNGKGYIAFMVLHFFAFALALTVCGLYGVDLTRARESGVAADPKWVFAEVVAGISVFTTLVYLIPFVLRFAGVPIWNLILFILWIAVFGVFGSMYINEDPEGDQGIQRMKNAVWVDLANALLWLIIAIASGVYWWSHRERRSRFTGRARLCAPGKIDNKPDRSQTNPEGQTPTIPITFDAFPILKALFFMSPLSNPTVAMALNVLTSQVSSE